MRHLPARLDDARDVPAKRQVAEANAAEIELPQEGPRTSTLLASVVVPDPPLRRLLVPRHIDSFCHDDYVLKGMPK
jgi:hypothetical protein